MRRALAVLTATAIVLAVAPVAARALFAPSITVTSPQPEALVTGDLMVTWSYEGFSPKAWVDLEVRRGEEPFRRIARVRIDDGTSGDNGSVTWPTAPADDGDDYTIRVIVPSNKKVHDSVSPVVVDNTGPEVTEVSRTPAANDAGWNNEDVTVTWACTDATSGVVEPEVSSTVTDEGRDLVATATCEDVAGHTTTATASGIHVDRTAPTASLLTAPPADGVPAPAVAVDIAGSASDELSGVADVRVVFTDAAGATTERAATCTGCGTGSATWTVSTQGLAPGRYTVTATATDLADNVGEPAAADFLVVPLPTPPEPPDPPEPSMSFEAPAPTEPEPGPDGSLTVSVTVGMRRP